MVMELSIYLYDAGLTFEYFKEIMYEKAPLSDYCILRTKLWNDE